MKKVYILLLILFPFFISDSGTLEPELSVTFFNVESADSILIKAPDTTILIDGGDEDTKKSLVYSLKKRGVNSIDHLILTHPHKDHFGGLDAIVTNFKIHNFYTSTIDSENEEFLSLLELIKNKSNKTFLINSPTNLDFSNYANIKVLSPKSDNYNNDNNFSIVIKISFEKYTFLFMGDAEKEIENQLISENINCNFLKVGHHGSNTSSSEDFVKKVSPDFSIISVGKYNNYNHPSKATLATLNKYTEKNIFRTDINGTIDVIIKDNKCIINTEK
ncbi:Metallo-beta-lactamase family protein [Clostridium bornimense]|uniref:Metallo-beta-lactamase family protein n=1 Tax=Clostridium bornimense TaxID=1216932 RepID=W6RVV0_9CLOT|nr:ComEC/Rec2 family competence protein [Clostridium bornimense]CDM68468.1 Metallo-beta-lactamase family protein [Clostridium bornimense]